MWYAIWRGRWTVPGALQDFVGCIASIISECAINVPSFKLRDGTVGQRLCAREDGRQTVPNASAAFLSYLTLAMEEATRAAFRSETASRRVGRESLPANVRM